MLTDCDSGSWKESPHFLLIKRLQSKQLGTLMFDFRGISTQFPLIHIYDAIYTALAVAWGQMASLAEAGFERFDLAIYSDCEVNMFQ